MEPFFLNNVLSQDHCQLLEKNFFKEIKNKEQKWILSNEGICGWESSPHVINTKAIYGPYAHLNLSPIVDPEKFLIDLTKTIKEKFNRNVKYNNAFIRAYYNGSHLELHNDREPLDITLSVNVGGLENWPIHISNILSEKRIAWDSSLDDATKQEYLRYKQDYKSYITPRGSGIVCYGKYPHWRDKLVCSDNEYVLQIFYHWKIVE